MVQYFRPIATIVFAAVGAPLVPRIVAEEATATNPLPVRRQCSALRMSQSMNGTCELLAATPIISWCLSAEFGAKLPPKHEALKGTPVLAASSDGLNGSFYGCGEVGSAANIQETQRTCMLETCILIVRRGGGCAFADKARFAAELGASGLVVVNYDNALSPMGGVPKEDQIANGIEEKASISGLVVVMIGQTDGEKMIAAVASGGSSTAPLLAISSPRESEMLEHGQPLPWEHRIASWRSFAARRSWSSMPFLTQRLLDCHSTAKRIPRVIIQTWKQPIDELPPDFARMSATVQRLHPRSAGWRYLFFDDKQVAEFVRTKFPELWATFVAFPYNIQRVDFFRLLAVSHYGGFYLDLDMDLSKPLEALRNRSAIFPFELASGENMEGQQVGQYAFGALPGHPFLRAVIDNIVTPRFDTRGMTIDKHILYTTGPVVVTQTLRDCQLGGRRENLRLFNSVDVLRPQRGGADDDKDKWFRFGDYGQHRMASSWHKQVVGSRLSKDEFICEEGSRSEDGGKAHRGN